MVIPKARKLTSGNYCIELRLGGERISITRRTERDCRREAQIVKAEYLAGKRVAAPASPTLGAAIDAYIAKRSNVLSPSTIAGYRKIKRTRFTAYTDTPLAEMDASRWQRAVNDEARECSPKTVKNTWGFVASVLKDNGLPVPRVKLPQVPVPDLPFLQPEQIDTFIKAVHGTKVEIPALLALSSLRKSEILALTWDNVDLARNIIHVRGAAVMVDGELVRKPTNKNDTSNRDVPIMIPALKTALADVENKRGLVAPNAENTMYDRINRICAKNGLPQVGVHGLRRSFVSLGFHLGVPEEIIMQIGGWADYQTMRKHYKRLAQSDVNKFTDALTKFFADENADENPQSPVNRAV